MATIRNQLATCGDSVEYTNRFGQQFRGKIRHIPEDTEIGVVVERTEWPRPECVCLENATEYPFVTIFSRQR